MLINTQRDKSCEPHGLEKEGKKKKTFQDLAIVNNAAMNIGVHRFFGIGVSGSLGYNPSSGIAGQKTVPFLIF